MKARSSAKAAMLIGFTMVYLANRGLIILWLVVQVHHDPPNKQWVTLCVALFLFYSVNKVSTVSVLVVGIFL